MDLNKVIIIGTIETIEYVQVKESIRTKLSVKISESFKDKTFSQIIPIEYYKEIQLMTGERVLIEGSVKMSPYENKNTGKTTYFININAYSIKCKQPNEKF